MKRFTINGKNPPTFFDELETLDSILGEVNMKTKKKAAPSGVGELLTQFGDGHKRTYQGTPYLCAFKIDARIMRDMLAVYSVKFLRELIACFWMAKQKARTDDEYFIGKAKPSVRGFRGALPNLISEFEFDTPPDERAAVGPAQGELPEGAITASSKTEGALCCTRCDAELLDQDQAACQNCGQVF